MSQVEGFAKVERAYLRRVKPGFEWTTYETPSFRNRLKKALSEATVALVSTSGVRLADQPRFDLTSLDGDPSYRPIPVDTPLDQLRFNHAGYDVRNAYADPDSVFPLPLLQRYAAEGRIGMVAARAYGLMGYITQTDVLVHETGEAIAKSMSADGVDLALMVPT